MARTYHVSDEYHGEDIEAETAEEAADKYAAYFEIGENGWATHVTLAVTPCDEDGELLSDETTTHRRKIRDEATDEELERVALSVVREAIAADDGQGQLPAEYHYTDADQEWVERQLGHGLNRSERHRLHRAVMRAFITETR